MLFPDGGCGFEEPTGTAGIKGAVLARFAKWVLEFAAIGTVTSPVTSIGVQ